MRELAKQTQQFKFVWQNKPFHVNAVYSLVPLELFPGKVQSAIEHASALAESAFTQGNIGKIVVDQEDTQKNERIKYANWLGQINEALSQNHFTLVAQPIIPINKTNTVNQNKIYFEILLRMQGYDNELISPFEFIPHAESFNLMPNIDRWVVLHTLQWLSSKKVTLEKIAICSINLSGQSVADPAFFDDIVTLIDQYNLPAEKLCFEITETVAIANMSTAISFVTQLRNLGCSVALDDFGSGLSSFEYLKKLPLNIIKIDGAFIQNISESATDYTIVEAILRVANTMNLTTVAEYVESKEALKLLSEMGITFVQGYYTGKPVLLDNILIPENKPINNEFNKSI